MTGQSLCSACLTRLQPDRALPRCRRCAHPLIGGHCPDCGSVAMACDSVVAAFDYVGLGRDLIHDYKFHGHLALTWLLADRLVQAVRAAGPRMAWPDWIVPVPARREGLRRRGFSPPAEVARLLARQLRLRYRLDGVRRLREGTRQVGRDRALRLQAQADVFACGIAGGLAGRRIAVVDDVLTTGATLQAVAMTLKAAGAAQVEGWVLARAVSLRVCRSSDSRVLQ